jgi:hypothetical protein
VRAPRAGAAVIGIALALSACGTGAGKPSAGKPGNAKSAGTTSTVSGATGASMLVAAAVKSSEAPGEKVGLSVSIETPQLGTVSISGGGAYDNTARSGSLLLAVSIPSNSSLGLVGSFLSGLQIGVVSHDATVYAELPETLSGVLSSYTGGKPWLRANLAQLATNRSYGGLASVLNSSGGLTNPIAALEHLSSAGVHGFTTVGPATVHGVATTRYRADVDLTALESAVPAAERAQLTKLTGIRTIPYTVDIDSSGRIRMVAFTVRPQLAGVSATVTVASDVLAYGPQAVPRLPPAGETVNLASVLSRL